MVGNYQSPLSISLDFITLHTSRGKIMSLVMTVWGHILQEAFEAHSECKYNLSVPVFLAQADGIFWETTPKKQSLFIKC